MEQDIYDVRIWKTPKESIVVPLSDAEASKGWMTTYAAELAEAVAIELVPNTVVTTYLRVPVLIPLVQGCKPVFFKRVVRALRASNREPLGESVFYCIGWQTQNVRIVATVREDGVVIVQPEQVAEERQNGSDS